MNKWLRELKFLTSNKDVIEYYKKMIEEEGLETYEEICEEIGTPQKIYDEEKSSSNIEENKLTQAGFKTVSFFKKLAITILLFALFIAIFVVSVLTFAAVMGLVLTWIETDLSLKQRLLQTLLFIIMIPTTISFAWLIKMTISNAFRMYRGKSILLNKKVLKFIIPIVCIGLVTGGITTYVIQTTPYEKANLKTYTQTFNDNFKISLLKGNVNIVSGKENKITFKTTNDKEVKNNELSLNKKWNIGYLGNLFKNEIETNATITLKKDQNLNISVTDAIINLTDVDAKNIKITGIKNTINLNNSKLKTIDLHSIDSEFTINKSNIDNVKISDISSDININSSNINKFDTKNIDFELTIKDSKIQKFNGDKNSQNITSKNSTIGY